MGDAVSGSSAPSLGEPVGPYRFVGSIHEVVALAAATGHRHGSAWADRCLQSSRTGRRTPGARVGVRWVLNAAKVLGQIPPIAGRW